MYFRPNRYRLNSGFILNVHTNKGKWVKTVNFLFNFISPDYRYELKSYKNSVEYAKSEYSYIYKSVKSIQLCSYKWQFTLHGKIYDHIRRTHVYWTYYSLRIIKVIKKKKILKKILIRKTTACNSLCMIGCCKKTCNIYTYILFYEQLRLNF